MARSRQLWSRVRSGLRNPSTLGALTGCLLTTLAYLAFTGSLSPRWSAISSRGEDFNRQLNMFQVGGEVNPEVELEKFHRGRSSFTRKMLLEVVATSRSDLKAVTHKVNTSWGRDSSDWRLAVGMGAGELETADSTHILSAPQCVDFPTGEGYMSPAHLFCLLEAVYNSDHFHSYRWFIFSQNFAADSMLYISVHYLQRLLSRLDPDTVMYMGAPSETNLGYCTGQSGIILSQLALKLIVPHLPSCLEGDRATVGGDEALGACFEAKLQRNCYEWEEPASFVRGFQGISMSSQSKWMESHGHFVTVFPVQSAHHMQVLHIVDLMRELDYQRKLVQTRSDDLYNSSLCRLETLEVTLDPPQRPTEVKGWSVANPNSTYVSNHLEPRYWYDGEIKMELEMVAKRALAQMNKINGTDHHFKRVMYAYYRYRGTDGRETIIDVETQSKIIIRMHVLRPFLFKPILLEDSGVEAINKTIDFVVPLSNVISRFAEFMKTYEDVCLKFGENCRLNLVIYGYQDMEIIRSNLTVYKAKYPTAQFNLIPGEGKFSRGRALRTGIESLPKSSLAFTCDVDMTIDRSFLNHCRRNAIQGRRVYYPEVFKYYDMAYVYRFEPKPLFGYDISRKHGHWCTYGYGMLCIYKSDYDIIGGYDAKIEGWGGEDIQLIDDIINRGLEVMRAPDPALSHRYHPKVCSKKLTKPQYSQCVTSRNEDIADRRRLADYIFYLENKCNIKKKIWD